MTIAILKYIEYLSLITFFFWLFIENIFKKNDRDANKVVTKKSRMIFHQFTLAWDRLQSQARFTSSSFVWWWSESVLAVLITQVLPAGFAINNYVIGLRLVEFMTSSIFYTFDTLYAGSTIQFFIRMFMKFIDCVNNIVM